MISVAGLSYSYPDGRIALDNLHFAVHEHESVGLIGPNGAGKTTLFLCLCGVLPVRRGTITIANLDPADPDHRKQLPRKVGIVFQNSDDQLFSSTVFDDVAFGPLNMHLPAEEVRLRVAEALRSVGWTGADDRVPFHLSGGEKRRAAIAGVLAMRPEVMLLDEPSMFLDPRGRKELRDLIRSLPGTKVIATHDLQLVRETCTRVVVLDGGRVVADGNVAEVMADPEWMAQHGLE